MPILNWNDTYLVGVEKIDHQHKSLVDLINRAYDHADDAGDDLTLRQLAEDMTSYALMHFSTEEELIQAFGFQDAAGHLAMHEDFRAHAAQYETDAASGKSSAIETVQYLSNWLQGHILGSDKKLGRFLNEQGIF